MKVKDILLSKDFNLITDKSGINNEIKGIFSSDLLSHVMGNANIGNILVTVLNNINVLGVASLLDLSCVIFSHSIKVNNEVVIKANELNIPLLSTKLPTVATVLTLNKMGIEN